MTAFSHISIFSKLLNERLVMGPISKQHQLKKRSKVKGLGMIAMCYLRQGC